MIAFMAVEIPASIVIARLRSSDLLADVTTRFSDIQRHYVGRQLALVREALEAEVEALDTMARDYALWDSMADFMRTRSAGFLAENFSARSLRDARIDSAIVLALDGSPVVALASDPGDPDSYRSADPGAIALLGPGLLPGISEGSPSAGPPEDGARFLAYERGTLTLVSSFPILRDGARSPAGFLAFGRRLGDHGSGLRSVIDFRILSLAEAGLGTEGEADVLSLEPGRCYVPPEELSMDASAPDRDYVRGYALLDASLRGGGYPLVIEARAPSDLLKEQRRFVRDQEGAYLAYSAVYLGGITLTNIILFAVMLIVLDTAVLARIYGISQGAMRIARAPDSTEEIAETGDDELSRIGAGFNEVLRSFRSRQAEVIAANQRLRYAYREISISHQALNASLLPVIVTDSDGRITRSNRAFCDVFGYAAEETEGRKPDFINPGRAVYRDHGIDDEAYDRLFRGLWESLGDDGQGNWEGTVLNKRKTGEIVQTQLVINAIRSEGDGKLGFVAWMVDLSKRAEAEERTRLEVYRAISELAETRDSDTGDHLRRIGALARSLAERLGWGPRMLRDIEVFAPLHDVGKVGIMDAVLLNPNRLTPEEMAVMRSHADIGYAILRGKPTMEMAAEIAHSHHEWWDGSGYPQGLSGEAIPVSARIVAIVDVYDALRSRRPYKEPWTAAAAREEMSRLSGRQFDPSILRIFLEYADLVESLYAPRPNPDSIARGLA